MPTTSGLRARTDAMEKLLARVSEEQSLLHAEALRPSSSGMVLCAATFCRGEQVEVYHEESNSFTFPLQVGIPGRVWMSSQVEWHADVSVLPTSVFLRQPLAVRAGLKGAVAVPFSVPADDHEEETTRSLALHEDSGVPIAKTETESHRRRQRAPPAKEHGAEFGLHEKTSSSGHFAPERTARFFVLVFYSGEKIGQQQADAIVASVGAHAAVLKQTASSAVEGETDPVRTRRTPRDAGHTQTKTTQTKTVVDASAEAHSVDDDGQEQRDAGPGGHVALEIGHVALASESIAAEEAVTGVLTAVCEASGFVYGEALRGRSGRMMLCGTHYGAGPEHHAFHLASLAYEFPAKVGIPGRVWSKRRMEWHSDVTMLTDDRFLRRPLAVTAGLRGVVAMPFALGASSFVLCLFADTCLENDQVLKVLDVASGLLQRLRVSRHPQRQGVRSKLSSGPSAHSAEAERGGLVARLQSSLDVNIQK